MSSHIFPSSEEIEQLLRNARLRDELEPYLDESVALLDIGRIPTSEENDFLESLLAWERAPIVPISQWFEPELVLPPPETLRDEELTKLLWSTIYRLYSKRVVLEYTEHLSDRQLYCLLMRDILPSPEKRIDPPRNWLPWHCLDVESQPEIWLQYYATPDERQEWSRETGEDLPPRRPCPFVRELPRRPADHPGR